MTTATYEPIICNRWTAVAACGLSTPGNLLLGDQGIAATQTLSPSTGPLFTCPVQLQDWQMFFLPGSIWENPASSDAGILMGPGTDFLINRVTEGWDMPAVNSHDEQWPRRSGQIIGLDVSKGRSFNLELWIAPLTGNVPIFQLLQTLATAFQVQGNTESPLWIKYPGFPPLAYMVRPRKRSFPIDITLSAASQSSPQLELVATLVPGFGPIQAFNLTFTTPPSGLTYPLTYPITYGLNTTTTTIVPQGNWPTYPFFTLIGPLTNPTLTVGDSSVTLSTGASPTLAAGQTATVDWHSRLALLTPQNIPLSVLPGASWEPMAPMQPCTVTLAGGTRDTGSATIYLPTGSYYT